MAAHLGEMRLAVDIRIHEQGQHLCALFDVSVGLQLEPVDGLFGGRIDLLNVAPYQGTEGAQEIVVQPLVAVVDEAQQVELDRLIALGGSALGSLPEGGGAASCGMRRDVYGDPEFRELVGGR